MHETLSLPNDRPPDAPTLANHLASITATGARDRALSEIVTAIAAAASPIARRLALGALPGDPAAIVGANASGDRQKALDAAAHAHVLDALATVSVRAVLSEEADDVVHLSPDGQFDVAIDPIDGSDSIGIGTPLGLLFAIFPAGDTFLRSGREVIAAGYISFGHSVDMGLSLGAGVNLATHNPDDGTFRVTAENVRIPAKAKVAAYNAANLARWPTPLRTGITELTGDTVGGGRNLNMRWLAAAVADLHRILNRGGLFLYPADSRPGYETGRLRLIYEAFPIAFLIEQAGGAASDGAGAILDRVPGSLHQNTPLIFGAADDVAALAALANQPGQGG